MPIVIRTVHHARNAALRFVNARDSLFRRFTIIHHYERHHSPLIVVLASEANLPWQHFLSTLDCIKLSVLPVKPWYHDVINALNLMVLK